MIMRKIDINKDWGTHIPLLLKVTQATDGSVLELGSGLFSTPLLHWLCEENHRKLTTYDDNKNYFKLASQYQSKTHQIHFVENWSDISLFGQWDVVLIDHYADRRASDALMLKDSAKYIVLHDTERKEYGYDSIWKEFKYVYHWRYCTPWTSVVSNFRI